MDNNPISSLIDDMGENLSKALKSIEERRQLASQIVLASISEGIKDKKREINSIKATQKGWRKAVINLMGAEIKSVADAYLAVPHFSQRAGAEQTIWLFSGTHWQILDGQEYLDFIKKCAEKMGLDEIELEDPNFMLDLAEAIAFRISGSKKRYVPEDEVLVNLQNGTLVIKSDGSTELREHNADEFLKYALPYAYDPKAECPLWRAFLDRMLPEKEAQDVLAEYIAYGFAKGIKIEKMLVLFGRGANGKSVVLDVITSLVGRVNVSNVSLSSLTDDDVKRAMIENKVFNISHESNRDLDASVLKQVVSGEPVDVRVLYVGPHPMYDYAKLITSFNMLPRAENTHGFYRRFLIIPFNVTISEEEMDVDLTKKLCEELPGILNWVLEAMPRLLKRRAFTKSALCEEALRKYRINSDSVLLFLTTCCKVGNCSTQGKELYDSYKGFCLNESVKYVGKQTFYDRLESAAGVIREDKANVPLFNIKIEDYESCRY